MANNRVKMEMTSRSENIAFARVAVAAFAAQLDFTLAEIEEIKVAISEAVSNCVIHGYQNRPDETVSIDMSIDDNRLIVSVEDFGVGIEDIEAAMQPAFTTGDERMGLGLVFIHSFMTEMELVSTPGTGTLVRMVKIPENQA